MYSKSFAVDRAQLKTLNKQKTNEDLDNNNQIENEIANNLDYGEQQNLGAERTLFEKIIQRISYQKNNAALESSFSSFFV